MELNHLRVFFEVAKAGRFTEAARKLNISQSALSRSVALLEDQEGVKLLERSKRGVTLTATGAEVFRHCEQLFQTVQKIEEVCRGVHSACEGPLRFATTDHVIHYLLPAPMQAFRREFPQVVPQVLIGPPDDIVAALLNSEDVDFGLSFVKVATPQITYEALREEPMALVVSSELWRERRGANSAATLERILNQEGYIASMGSHTQARPSQVLRELFGKMPRVGFEVNNQEAQKRICLAGGGVAYLSRFMVEKELTKGELQEIDVESPHSFKLWLATRKGRVLSTPARIFLERLRAGWG